MNQRIYVAEDDDNIREILRCALGSYGYEVQVFEEAAPLLQAAEQLPPDLVLLDIMMPGMDGTEALQQLRRSPGTRSVPAIFLTAKSSEVDKVRGLDLGADDYITKPFGLLELSARVRAVLRRGGPRAESHVLRGGDLELDEDNHELTRQGSPVELTLKEFELLRLLMTNASRVVPREELLNEIWGYDYLGETRTLDMHIKTLRAKLGDDAENPRYIKTVRAVGYKFVG